MATLTRGSRVAAATGALAGLGLAGPAWADPQFEPWQMGLQDPVTPVAEQMNQFHSFMLVIITLITLFVLGLLIFVLVRFREKRHPKPAQFTHNTPLEVIWTAAPVIILVIIAVPSFKLLYFQDVVPKTEMTVTTIGHQWYWEYKYDGTEINYNSYMLSKDELKNGDTWQLSTNNPLVLPADTMIRFQVTAQNVLHAFAMPSFGIKMDAIPGQINETWAKIEEPGVYYGQCSELCGTGHSNMPIEVKVLPKDEYQAWKQQRQANAGAGGGNTTLAQAQ